MNETKKHLPQLTSQEEEQNIKHNYWENQH